MTPASKKNSLSRPQSLDYKTKNYVQLSSYIILS